MGEECKCGEGCDADVLAFDIGSDRRVVDVGAIENGKKNDQDGRHQNGALHI